MRLAVAPGSHVPVPDDLVNGIAQKLQAAGVADGSQQGGPSLQQYAGAVLKATLSPEYRQQALDAVQRGQWPAGIGQVLSGMQTLDGMQQQQPPGQPQPGQPMIPPPNSAAPFLSPMPMSPNAGYPGAPSPFLNQQGQY